MQASIQKLVLLCMGILIIIPSLTVGENKKSRIPGKKGDCETFFFVLKYSNFYLPLLFF